MLALGEEAALQLGVDAERVKRRIFAGAALLTGAVVAFAGPIGFVGLVVPHALRMTLGPDNRVLVPAALLGGGDLPPPRRHAGAERGGARGAVGGRDHLVLRRAVLHLPAPLARGAGRAVTALLELRDVSFAYPPRDGRPGFAIRDLSLSVEPGEIFGVIGPNASGKTTLLRLLSKVRRAVARRGAPRAADRSALCRVPRWREQVAVVPQDAPHGFPFTVEELVLMGRFPHAPRPLLRGGRRRGGGAAGDGGGRRARRSPAARLDRLSGGERQRVMLARALCQKAPLLVLDEPTAHLDLRHQAECVELLRRLNAAAASPSCLISHDLNLAGELCDRLLLMQDGRSAASARRRPC